MYYNSLSIVTLSIHEVETKGYGIVMLHYMFYIYTPGRSSPSHPLLQDIRDDHVPKILKPTKTPKVPAWFQYP